MQHNAIPSRSKLGGDSSTDTLGSTSHQDRPGTTQSWQGEKETNKSQSKHSKDEPAQTNTDPRTLVSLDFLCFSVSQF
ncbi:MAG: hypothetical protein ACK55Z_04700, partial [bacterium]